jgi:hypothetical protein
MAELIDRVAQVGIDRAVAERSVGIILDFLSREGPAPKVEALLARLPDHLALIAKAGGADGSMGGIMGVGARLMGSGLDMSQIQNVIRAMLAYFNEIGAGNDLKAIVAAIPGLSAFI